MIVIIILLLIALSPCLFFLWYFYHRDKYDPEPKKKILTIYLAGAIMVIPAAVLEMLLIEGLNHVTTGFLNILVMSFIIIAPIEELTKFLIVKRWIYRSLEFNEVMDGIVYTVSASLGFATAENIFYVLTQGIHVGIARAFLAVPGHACFGALMGYYIGLAKFDKVQETKRILQGIILAIITHGLYDFLVLSGTTFAALAVFFIITLGFLVRWQLKKAELLSMKKSDSERAPPNDRSQTASP